jgi:hypothetical protein
MKLIINNLHLRGTLEALGGTMNNTAPIALRNAPLEYAPEDELGVVFLFSHIAKRLQFRIVRIQPQFPDCLAHRRAVDTETPCRVEFEFRSSRPPVALPTSRCSGCAGGAFCNSILVGRRIANPSRWTPR